MMLRSSLRPLLLTGRKYSSSSTGFGVCSTRRGGRWDRAVVVWSIQDNQNIASSAVVPKNRGEINSAKMLHKDAENIDLLQEGDSGVWDMSPVHAVKPKEA